MLDTCGVFVYPGNAASEAVCGEYSHARAATGIGSAFNSRKTAESKQK